MPKLTFNTLKVFDNYACSYWSVYALIIITIFFFCSKIKTQVGESILETWPMMHNARTLCPSGHWRRLGQNIGGHEVRTIGNSLFLNLDSTQIQSLQLIQNSLARAVTRTPRHHHITPVLKSLHWLKIPERIHFKVLSLTYNCLQSSQPTYLCKLFTI